MMKPFRVQGYIEFLENTKPSAMLVKDVLEERNITLVHANSGTSKTSAWGYDLAAAMLAQEPWLGRFEILAQNPYIFFVSQDAPAHDVIRHSQKVFRRYFNMEDSGVRDELNRRFNVLDYEGVKFGKDNVDAERLVESIRARLIEVQPSVPSFRDVSVEEVAAAQESLNQKAADSFDLPSVQPDDDPILEPKVLILWDSLRKLHDGKESASDELKPVIEGLRHVNRELDATSILFHHNNRSGTIRGDASIEDAVDQSYHIKRTSGCKATSVVQHFDLLVEKPRGIPVQPFRYSMTRENPHTRDEVIRFEYERELTEADLEKESRPRAPERGRAPSQVMEIDPMKAAVREHWRPGMSIRALHETLRKKLKLRVSRDRVGKLVEKIEAEGQVSLGLKALA